MSTKVLLTGASGTVGRCVLKQLTAQPENYEITLLEKATKISRKLLKPFTKPRFFWGDIRDKELVNAACQGQDVVIHLAAIIPPLADHKPELAYEVNVEGTRNIVTALENRSQMGFLLYSSSVAIYGDRLGNPNIRVSDPLFPSVGDDYAHSKIQAERIIQASQLNWSIFRLSAIFGIGNHTFSPLMFHMPLATSLEFTTPEDTARAFVRAISHRDVLNKQIVNLGGGEACRISYESFLMRSFEVLGLGKLSFPPHTFAEKNFHCGYFQDAEALENLLSFRQDSTESYFQKLKASLTPMQRFANCLFCPLFNYYLIRQSEPLRAIRKKDSILLKRFFTEASLQKLS